MIELRGLQGLRAFAERMTCEESAFTRKSIKWDLAPAVGLKQTTQTTQTTQPPSDDPPDVEADERLAIQTEHQIATRQSIPQERMVAGLLRAAQATWAQSGTRALPATTRISARYAHARDVGKNVFHPQRQPTQEIING
jgi:hypothetical protein